MAFAGRLRLALPAEMVRHHFPPLDTWLRLSPLWSVLALEPGADEAGFELRLRFDDDDREESFLGRFAPRDHDSTWQLRLVGDDTVRSIDIEVTALGAASELALLDPAVADGDGTTRTSLALWLRATADYILLAASRRWRARLSKWFLDRIWLRMNLTGRRVVILILAYEVVGLALLIAWLIWERVMS